MQNRSARGWLAATFLCTLLLPAVGGVAGPGRELDQIEDRLNDLRSNIDEGEGKADYYKRRIRQLGEDITELQIAINKLDTKIAKIESEVRTAQAAIDAKQEQIDELEGLATEQAVVLYKQGNTGVLDALLNSTSISDLNSRIEMLGIAASQNTDALVHYHRLQLELQGDQIDLFRKKNELSEVLADQSKIRAKLAERKSLLASDLAKLEDQIDNWRNAEGALEVEALKLTGQIQAAQARESVASMGESAQGFIWPLNGEVTSPYGERWGRMHTGIDINGYTGQPVVASKSGVVIMASYYSGYGNAVIIDHGGGYATLYAHLSAFDTSEGKSIEQGELVGKVGCTGSCTGDHLHFEVRINGNPVDPMDYLP